MNVRTSSMPRVVSGVGALAVLIGPVANAYAYMGPGAGRGALPGVGLGGILAALLIVALVVLALSLVGGACYAVGRRCLEWLTRRAFRQSTGAVKSAGSGK